MAHFTLSLLSVNNLVYRPCQESDRDPTRAKAKGRSRPADPSAENPSSSNPISIQIRCHQFSSSFDSLPSQSSYDNLQLRITVTAASTADLVDLLIENSVHVLIYEYNDSTSSYSNLIATATLDILEGLLRDEGSVEISFPLQYNELVVGPPLQVISDRASTPSCHTSLCSISIDSKCIPPDHPLQLLHLHISDIQVGDESGSNSSSTSAPCQYFKDQVQAHAICGPLFPAPGTKPFLSIACSAGPQSNHISCAPFCLYLRLVADQCMQLIDYIKHDPDPVIQFHVIVNRTVYLLDTDDPLLSPEIQGQFNVNLRSLLHPIPDLSTTCIQGPYRKQHLSCYISLSLHRALQSKIPGSLKDLLDCAHHTVPLWSNTESMTHDLIKDDVILGLDLIRSHGSGQVLYHHIRPRFIVHLDRKYELYRRISRSDPSPDLTQAVLSDQISSYLKADVGINISDNIDQVFLIAQLYMSANLFEQALEVFHQIIVQYPSERLPTSLYRDMSRCYLKLGQRDYARVLFDRYLNADSKMAVMATCTAIEYEEYGRARRLLLAGMISDIKLYQIIQRIYTVCCNGDLEPSFDTEYPQDPLQDAELLQFLTELLQWNLGRICHIAVEMLIGPGKDLYRTDPVTALRTETFIIMKRFKEARSLLPTISDDLVRSELNAHMEYEDGDLDAALQCYKQSWELGSEHIRTLYRYAKLASIKSMGQIALQIYTRLISIYPVFTEAWCQLAALYNNLPNYQLHQQHALSEAIRPNPYNKRPWLYLSDLSLKNTPIVTSNVYVQNDHY